MQLWGSVQGILNPENDSEGPDSWEIHPRKESSLHSKHSGVFRLLSVFVRKCTHQAGGFVHTLAAIVTEWQLSF